MATKISGQNSLELKYFTRRPKIEANHQHTRPTRAWTDWASVDNYSRSEDRRSNYRTEWLVNMGGTRLTTENTERDIQRMKDEISSGIPVIFPWTLGKEQTFMARP